MKKKIQYLNVCPRCGKAYSDYPALSRVDNETEICPECGVAEAMFDYGKYVAYKEMEVVK